MLLLKNRFLLKKKQKKHSASSKIFINIIIVLCEFYNYLLYAARMEYL